MRPERARKSKRETQFYNSKMSQQGSNLTSHCGGLVTVVSDSCDPTDNSPPGSSVHGILQARTQVGCHFLPQGSSLPRNWTQVPCIAKTNLDSILKSRPLPTKVHRVKALVFPVVICGCESCTMKKAEHRRTDAFELWCWRRLLRVPWTARRSNQSILKEISSDYSLEVLMLKLKLQ